jgi:PEP-CTERM motif
MKSIALIAAAATLAAATAGHAATQFVVNGDFTELSNGPGNLQNGATTTATGWSTSGYNFAVASASADTAGVSFWDASNSSGANSWNGLAAGVGNFLAMDGEYQTGPATQQITGLTVGDSYHLSFSYAFGQQENFTGPTVQYLTETLGGQSFVSASTNVASQGFTGWMTYSVNIVASATSETLSFLATGNVPVPPFAFVSNVSLTGGVPEPATWAMMLVGIGLIGGTTRRRRAAVAVAA